MREETVWRLSTPRHNETQHQSQGFTGACLFQKICGCCYFCALRFCWKSIRVEILNVSSAGDLLPDLWTDVHLSFWCSLTLYSCSHITTKSTSLSRVWEINTIWIVIVILDIGICDNCCLQLVLKAQYSSCVIFWNLPECFTLTKDLFSLT